MGECRSWVNDYMQLHLSKCFLLLLRKKCRCSLCKTFDPKGCIEGRTAYFIFLHFFFSSFLKNLFLFFCNPTEQMKAFKAPFLNQLNVWYVLYGDDFKKSILYKKNGLQLFCKVSEKKPCTCQALFSNKLLVIWKRVHLLASLQGFYTFNYFKIILIFTINYHHFNKNTSANVYDVMTITTSIIH